MALTVTPKAGTQVGNIQFIDNYIVATGLDNTDPANGPAISNDGSVYATTVAINVTASGGTSPVVALRLEGSNDGTNWNSVLDSGNNPVSTGNLSIASPTVNYRHDTQAEGIVSIPYRWFRWVIDLGGTSPTWTGTVSVTVIRRPKGRLF